MIDNKIADGEDAKERQKHEHREGEDGGVDAARCWTNSEAGTGCDEVKADLEENNNGESAASDPEENPTEKTVTVKSEGEDEEKVEDDHDGKIGRSNGDGEDDADESILMMETKEEPDGVMLHGMMSPIETTLLLLSRIAMLNKKSTDWNGGGARADASSRPDPQHIGESSAPRDQTDDGETIKGEQQDQEDEEGEEGEEEPFNPFLSAAALRGANAAGLAGWMALMAEHLPGMASETRLQERGARLHHHQQYGGGGGGLRSGPLLWPPTAARMASSLSKQMLSHHLQFGSDARGGMEADLAMSLYSHHNQHNLPRPESASSSASPPGIGHGGGFGGFPGSSSGGLVVPQPINASKMQGMESPHLAHHAGHLNGAIGARKYQCKMCPQVFGSKADLQLHTQVHMREPKPYKCSQCSKSFANSSYLSQHMRIHLGIKPYRCEICQRKFTQLSHLQQHIRTHTGDKPYKCRHPGCTKAFSQLSNLQSHSRCHQTDKPYKCNSCYKCFHDEASLLDHIPKHKESKHLKTHICSYCGKSYTQETYLAKHMQKHSDRSDKRPPILASGTATNNGSGGVGNGNGSTSPGASAAAAAVAAASMSQLMSGLPSPGEHNHPHHYWPKMDGGYGTYGHHLMMEHHNHHHHHQRLSHDPRDYDPRGLHPGAAMAAAQGLMVGEDLRQHHAGASSSGNSGSSASGNAGSSGSHLGGGWGSAAGDHSPSSSSAKTSSAFSPLQSAAGMLHSSTSAGFNMGSAAAVAARGYAAFYDPLAFSQASAMPKVNFGEAASSSIGGSSSNAGAGNSGSGGNSFAGPQLLSLSKIKNYAHNPHNDGLFKSLSSLAQDKGLNQLGQLGAAQ